MVVFVIFVSSSEIDVSVKMNYTVYKPQESRYPIHRLAFFQVFLIKSDPCIPLDAHIVDE